MRIEFEREKDHAKRVLGDRIILPEEQHEEIEVVRVQVTNSELCQLLGVGLEFGRRLMKKRRMHEMSSEERASGGGLISEEFVGLLFQVHLLREEGFRFAESFKVNVEATMQLLNPEHANERIIGAIGAGEANIGWVGGDIVGPPEVFAALEFYDLSALLDRVESAIFEAPLRLPAFTGSRVYR